MARWRLINAHYLNTVEATEWEYKETDRTSGKQGRKVFKVPLHLDPNNAADYNYPDGIIVADKASALYPRDIIFTPAQPTPEMEPLDEEATKISAACAHKWKHPIESLPGQGYSASLLADFEKQLAEAMAGRVIPAANPVAVAGVSREEFVALQEQIAALTARNLELEAQPQPKIARRA